MSVWVCVRARAAESLSFLPGLTRPLSDLPALSRVPVKSSPLPIQVSFRSPVYI